MPAVLLASTDGAGWTIETADLRLTGRGRGRKRVSADPLGDGPQLIVCRYGRVVASEIAGPGQVGDEEQHRDQPPGLPGAGEEGETGSGDGQPFDPPPGQWPAGDHIRSKRRSSRQRVISWRSWVSE